MSRRLANPAWAALEYLVVPTLTIVSAPLILGASGAEGYAAVIFFTTLVAIGNSLSGGTSVVIVRGLTLDPASKELLSTSLAVAALSGVALSAAILAFFALGGAAVFTRLGNTDLLLSIAVSACLVITLDQIDAVCSAVFRAEERFGSLSSVELVGRILQFGGALLALLILGEVAAYPAAFCVGALLRVIAKVLVLSHRRDSRIKHRPSLSSITSFVSEVRWGWAQGLAGTMFSIVDRLVIGSVLGSHSLAYYSLASQIAIQVHALTAAASSSVMPRLVRSLSSQSLQGRTDYLQLLLGSIVTCSVLALVVAIFGKAIVTLWIGAGVSAEVYPILVVLAFAYWVLGLNIGPHFLLLSNGRFRLVAVANLIGGCVFISLLALASVRLDVLDVAWARCSYGVVLFAFYYPLVRRLWLRNW